jgi:hypothetical protein
MCGVIGSSPRTACSEALLIPDRVAFHLSSMIYIESGLVWSMRQAGTYVPCSCTCSLRSSAALLPLSFFSCTPCSTPSRIHAPLERR